MSQQAPAPRRSRWRGRVRAAAAAVAVLGAAALVPLVRVLGSHTAAAGGSGSTFAVVEDRTLLGPASLDEPSGHLDRCLVVAVSSRATSAGGAVSAAGATLWYCEGVGLARAVLRGGAAGDTIDL